MHALQQAQREMHTALFNGLRELGSKLADMEDMSRRMSHSAPQAFAPNGAPTPPESDASPHADQSMLSA